MISTASSIGGTDGQNLKKIERDYDCGFWKVVSLTVFQSSFLLVVTFDIMLERHLFDTKL